MDSLVTTHGGPYMGVIHEDLLHNAAISDWQEILSFQHFLREGNEVAD